MRILKNVSVTSAQGWSHSEPWSVSAAGQDSGAPSSRGHCRALMDSGLKGVKYSQASSMAPLWNRGPWELTQVASGCSLSPALDQGSSCAVFLDSFWTQDVNGHCCPGSHTRTPRLREAGPLFHRGEPEARVPSLQEPAGTAPTALRPRDRQSRSPVDTWALGGCAVPHNGRRQAAAGRGTARLRPIHVLEMDPRASNLQAEQPETRESRRAAV